MNNVYTRYGMGLKTTAPKKKSNRKIKGGDLNEHNQPYKDYLDTHPNPFDEYAKKNKALSDEANSIDPNFLKNSGNLQELTELNNRLKSLTDKPSGYNYTPSEKKQIKDLGTKIRTLNLKRSNTSQISPQLKKIYDEMVLNLKEWKEFKRGYDDCINAYVKDGSASLWQRLDIDAIPQDTPYNRGRYYAAITLRAGWAYTDYSKSKWEQAFDVAKDSLSFGITIASHLV